MEPNPLRKFIESCNPAKLENYLKKHKDATTLVTDEILKLACDKFLESNSKNISNSYEVFKTLAQHHPVYVIQLQEEQEFKEKYAEYVEHKASRDVTKFIDDAIDKKIIFPIKYPENTSFVRKLLHLPPKRPPEEIYGGFYYYTNASLKKIRDEVLKNEKFKNASGENIIPDERLNYLLYQRLKLKASKDLRVSPETIDDVISESNSKKLAEHILGLPHNEAINVREKVRGFLKQTIPPGMVNKDDVETYIKENEQLHEKKSIGRLKGVAKSLSTKEIYQTQNFSKLNGASFKSKDEYYQSLLQDMAQKKHMPKNNLCAFEHEGIRLLNLAKSSKDKIDFSESEKKFLSSFIEYSFGNKQFNKRMQSYINKGVHSQEVKKILSGISKFSYKTQNFDDIKKSQEKLSNLLQLYNDKKAENLSEKDKISLYDLGTLDRFVSYEVRPIVNIIREYELNTEKLNGIKEVYDKASLSMIKLKKKISSEIKVQDGHLVMDVARKYHKLGHHKRSIENILQDAVTSYSHAALGGVIRSEGGTKSLPSVREIQGKYYESEIDPMHFLVTDNFRILPERLINPSLRGKVMRLLDLEDRNFELFLSEKYKGVSQSLGNQEQLSNLSSNEVTNSSERRREAGLADFIPFGHHGKVGTKAWAERILDGRSQDQSKTIGEFILSEDKDIICSEFAAKMTILSLVELERRLIDEIREKDPNFVIPKEGLIKLPFNRDEDLSKVSPERLVKQLKRVNAIELVEKTGIAKDIIQR